ncbi:MAG: hypothetical protein R3F59_21185 [Myxococcota bacterium]
MSDPFDPPEDPHWITGDPWITACRGVLWFTGACYLLLGLASGPLFGFATMVDPETKAPPEIALVAGAVGGGVMLVVCGGIAAVNFAAAWGLVRGRMWAWVLTLIVGGIYAPSGCLPFGAVLLYGVLNERTRKRFRRSAPASRGA